MDTFNTDYLLTPVNFVGYIKAHLAIGEGRAAFSKLCPKSNGLFRYKSVLRFPTDVFCTLEERKRANTALFPYLSRLTDPLNCTFATGLYARVLLGIIFKARAGGYK